MKLDLFTQAVSDPLKNFFDVPRENSLDTYHETIEPELTNRQEQVLNAIEEIGPCTMHEVSNFMGVPLNTISGRFGELVKKNKIYAAGRIDRKTIYKVMPC